MKTSFPPNSMSSHPVTNDIVAGVMKAMKRFASAIGALLPGVLMSLAYPSVAQAADSETQGKTVAFVPGVMGNAFYVRMECGIRAEAAKYGFKVDIQGAPAIRSILANTDCERRCGGEARRSANCADRLEGDVRPDFSGCDAGIKVALVDTTLDDTSKVITAIATDNTAGGAAAADALAKLIGEKGEVMVIAFQAGASTSDQRQKGFEGEIKKYPNIKYIGFQISNNDPSKAAAEVGSTLAAHPDLAGIFATNDRSAEGAATGLRVADKVGVGQSRRIRRG